MAENDRKINKERNIPGCVKNGLAKISTYFTMWQWRTIKLIQRSIESHFSICHGIDNKLNETFCTNCHLICKYQPLVQCHESPLKLDLRSTFLGRELLFEGIIS